MKLKSGEVLTFADFFIVHEGTKSDLVIEDDQAGGTLWLAEYEEPWDGADLVQLDSLDTLVEPESGIGMVPLLLLGGAGAAGAVALASDDGGSGHNYGSGPKVMPDEIAPERPVIKFNNKHGLTGTSEANATVTLYRPDGTTVVTQADKNGLWHFNPNPMGEGEQGYVSAKDASSNESEKTSTGVTDITPPDAPVVDQNNLSGLTGTSEPGATITLTLPGGNTVTVNADENGHWAFIPNPLEDGEQGKVTATDKAGNEGDYAETGAADVTPPSPPVVENNNESGLGGSGEAGGTIVVERPDGSTVTTIVDENGHWEIHPNPLGEGEKGSVTITDPNGNTSEPTETDTTDLSAPDAPIVESNNLGGLTGTGEAGSTITLTKPDGSTVTTVTDANGKWAMQPNPLADGEEGKVTATDPSGNVSGETATGKADLIAPDAPVIESNNESGLGGSAEAGGTIVVKLPDGSTLTTTVDENGHWLIQPNPLDDGESANVTVTDEAGNISKPVNTGGSDVIAPDAPIVESNNLGGLTGTGEAGSTITLTKPDGSTVTTVTDANGKWAMQPNPLADGEEGKVTATDPSGNVSGETATGKADLIAPDAPVIETNNETGLG
uniref:Ig-like domain-containing protein n=1 Tax=Pseudomonas sp. TTU2014-080ASC TaxID=1729724 RepID=UPI001F4CFED5